MKLIPLTQGKFAQVDDEDYERINKYKWCAHKQPDTYYAVRTCIIKGKQVTLQMHREILLLDTLKESDLKLVCDHKSRNGLNNQKSNLRICTKSQNLCNSKSRKNSTSKYLGVYKSINNKKYIYWVAGIQVNKTKIYLGCFKNEIDAAKAYNDAAVKYHGEFANINII